MRSKDWNSKLPVFALALFLGAAGCKSNQNASTDQTASTGQDQTAAPADQGQNPSDPGDPANSNLAPIPASYTPPANSTPAPAPAPTQASAPSQAPPPDTSQTYDSGAADNGDYSDASYNDTPVDYATQPPPPLPDRPTR